MLAWESQKTRKAALAIMLCMMLGLGSSQGIAAWVRVVPSAPSSESPVGLAECANSSVCFYLATAHTIFKNNQNQWRAQFSISETQDSILRIDTFNTSSDLWIRTEQGVYQWTPATEKKARVYESHDDEKKPQTFFAGKEKLWVGTNSGIWVSRDGGQTWQKRSDLADHLPVSVIAESSIGLFFSANGDWRFAEENSPQTVLKIFDFHEAETDSSETLSPETPSSSSSVFFDFIETEERFYLATIKGVFQSRNGIDWEMLPGSGLRHTAMKRIFWNRSAKQLIGFGDDGVFVFNSELKSWKSQNDGFAKLNLCGLLPASPWLAANSEGLWSWSDKTNSGSSSEAKALLLNRLIHLEPSARDIHKHIIRYSNTGNEKIKRWHAESRLASLLPNISLGKDLYRANNIDLDRGGTSDKDIFIEGPADKHRSASVDLSWDLGDFIFNSSQTSIDSREKLMVDQRNDLLSEATRLFYERRRLQAEIIYSPAEDEKAHLDHQLRLDELTSLLDALTDGYLSKKLEKLYEQHQEFEALWRFENKQ